jgi:hypothetical protein
MKTAKTFRSFIILSFMVASVNAQDITKAIIPQSLAIDLNDYGTSPVYHEENGLIAFEVEDHIISHPWVLETADSGYSGSGYVVSRGIPEWGKKFLDLRYFLVINKPGVYYFIIHNRHDHPHDHTEENDVWVKLNDGNAIKTFSHEAYKKWGWDTGFDENHVFTKPPKYFLEAGTYIFTLISRSSGFKMDRIHFYHEQNYTLNQARNLDLPLSKNQNTETSVVHPKLPDMIIYPNPVGSFQSFNIQAPDEVFKKAKEIRIFDITGKLVHQQILTDSREITLNAGFPAGIYSFRAGEWSARLIVR